MKTAGAVVTRAQEVQAEAKPLAKQGRPRKKVVDQDYHADNVAKQGSSSEYIAARLRRDHPEIAEAVRQR